MAQCPKSARNVVQHYFLLHTAWWYLSTMCTNL